MKLSNIKEDTGLNPFNTHTTNMATYDDMMKSPDYFRDSKGRVFNIVYMTPDEYIDRATEGFNRHEKFSREDVLRGRDQTLAQEYADLMMKGRKFPMVTLDFSSRYDFSGKKQKSFSQEGLHRAMAAKIAGVKKMPVMVVDDAE